MATCIKTHGKPYTWANISGDPLKALKHKFALTN